MPTINIEDLSPAAHDCVLDEVDSPEDGIELVQAGTWESDGKWEHMTNIFKIDGKFYSHSRSRTGSPYSDYEYEYDDCIIEVEPREVTVIVYESVD